MRVRRCYRTGLLKVLLTVLGVACHGSRAEPVSIQAEASAPGAHPPPQASPPEQPAPKNAARTGARTPAIPDMTGPDTADAGLRLPRHVEKPPRKRRYRMLAIGDSLTDPRSGGGGYLRYLQKACPESHFESFGVGGEMVNQMRRRLPRKLEASSSYTHLLVFGGVNDLYSDQTAGRVPSKIIVDLQAMYAAGRAAGLEVVALTVAPWGGFRRYYNQRRAAATRELNQWIVEQARAGGIQAVVETQPLLACGDPERLCPELAKPFRDGIHFGKLGHERLGKALHEQVFADCL